MLLRGFLVRVLSWGAGGVISLARRLYFFFAIADMGFGTGVTVAAFMARRGERRRGVEVTVEVAVTVEFMERQSKCITISHFRSPTLSIFF